MWKRSKYLSTYKWRNKKMGYVHSMKYYLAMKKNEVMTYTTIWITLNIWLNGRTQIEKSRYGMILCLRHVQSRQF